VGFAVPINVAKEILPQLRERGKVVRGWLGVQIQTVTEDLAKTLGMEKASGAIVSDVSPSSPADHAGLQPGDVIVAVDGEDMEDNNHLTRYISTKAPGTEVDLRLLRESETKSIRVTLGTFPDAVNVTEDRREPRAQLGMALRDLTPDLAARLELPRGTSGVVVMAVEAGEPAEDAGLRRLDVIVSVNGQPVAGVDDFEREIARAESVGLARLRLRRGGGYQITVLRLR
jgi:serine protease Do